MHNNYISNLIKEDVQSFLFSNSSVDVQDFILKTKEKFGIPASVLATQLKGRRKTANKLPIWYNTKGIVYPPTVNLEQASSEGTALFKKLLVKELLGNTGNAAIDLTGGFGVDSYFLSSLFKNFHYVEADANLFEVSTHNHHILGADNITHHQQHAEVFIKNFNQSVDLIYLDPSRRDDQARKIVHLKDCSPDVVSLQPLLFKNASYILVKASPLLDIQQGLREITHCKSVFVISINNECKELLFLAQKGFEGETTIDAVDLFEDGRTRFSFSFQYSEEQNEDIKLGEAENFIYEPNASILKAGAFKLLANKFQLKKLDVSTHLYASEKYVPGFPGRIFSVDLFSPGEKELHATLPHRQVNVITRNYPLTPDDIKKKFRLRDGGDKYLLGFTCRGKKMLALCSRVRGI